MDIKNLSFCQVCWAQKFSHYHFQIDYYQGKANGAADALSYFPQQDDVEKANIRAENTWILYCLQSSWTNALISGLQATVLSLLPQHQVLICKTYALPQPPYFWTTLQTKLANEGPYKASIGNIRLKLQELQETDSEAQELRHQKTNGYKNINEIFHYQGLLFVPEAIQIELISHYYDNLLAGHFGIQKTCKLLA